MKRAISYFRSQISVRTCVAGLLICSVYAFHLGTAGNVNAQSGTWTNTAGGSWPVPGNWSGGTIADGTDNTADFSTLDIGANATVTLDGARTIGHLTFGDTTPTNDWILNVGSGGPLTLDVSVGSPVITVNNQTATISLDLAGADGLTKSGAGTLLLNTTAKTFTGNVDITAGVYAFAGQGNANPTIGFGAGVKNVTLTNNAVLRPTSSSDPSATTKTFVIGAGGGTFDVPTGVTFTLNDGSGATGQLQGSGNLTVTGAGTGVVLLGNNYTSYTGGTVNVNSGTLRVTNAGGIGSGATTVNVASGATFDVQANLSGTKPVNLAGSLIASGGTGTIDDAVTLTGNATIGGNGTLNFTSSITDGLNSFSVTKNGTGLTVLGAANTYDGATNITAGTVRLDNANSIPGGLGVAGGTNNLNISGNAVVILNSTDLTRGLGAGATQARLTAGGGFAANGAPRTVDFGGAGATATWATADFLPGTSTLILGHTTANDTLTFANGINLNAGTRTLQVDNGTAAIDAILPGPITNGSITKTGLGTVQFTNVGNALTAISANAGTAEFTNLNSLGNATSATVGSNATLHLSGAVAGDWASPISATTFALSGARAAGAGTLASSGVSKQIDSPINVVASGAIGNNTAGTTLTVNNLSVALAANANFDGAGDITVNNAFGNGGAFTQANALAHFGYHINSDAAALNLNNNGGMLGGGNPANPYNGPNFFGVSVLTNGPGNRGLDFDNDTDFINTGSIGQADNYSNLFVGTFTPNTTGNWRFRFNMEDDSSGIWIDLNQNGIFESTGALNDNLGEQFRYDDTTTTGDIALTMGQTYLVAFTHRESGGGSQADVRFLGPAGSGFTTETVIRPADPAQSGLWEAITINPKNSVTKTGTGTTTLAGANTYNGITHISQGTLIAANNTALGLADGTPLTGTKIAAGGTLGLQGNITIGDEHITMAGGGSTIRNISGNNAIQTQSIVVTGDGATNIVSDAGKLSIGGSGTMNLGFSQLVASGAAETTITQNITAQSIGSSGTVAKNGLFTMEFNPNQAIAVLDFSNAGAPAGTYTFNPLTGRITQTTLLLSGNPVLTGLQNAIMNFDGTAAVGADPNVGPIRWDSVLGAGGGGDNFQIAWTGEFTPDVNGNYTFFGRGPNFAGDVDDDVSLYIDANNDGIFQSTEGFTTGTNGTIVASNLVAGDKYKIAMSFRDGTGGDNVSFAFQGPAGSAFPFLTGINPGAPGQDGFFTVPSLVSAPSTYHVVKDDPGILRLNGLLQFDGGVDVNAGTLIVNADNTAGGTPTGSWDVASGATLGGNGTINLKPGASVNISAFPGVVSPGDAGPGFSGTDPTFSAGLDAMTVGTLSFNQADGGMALDLGGTLQLDIFSDTLFDMIQATSGSILLGSNSKLTLNGQEDFSSIDFGALGIEAGDDDLLLISAADGLNGEFANAPLTAGQFDFDDAAGNPFSIIQDGNNLFLSAVDAAIPEPASVAVWTMLGLVAGGLALRRRRAK